MISSLGKYSNFGISYSTIATPAAPTSGLQVGGTSNATAFISFTLPGPYTIRSFYLYNGTTVNGNIDMGIYATNPGQTTMSLSRLVSTGPTAQTPASSVQVIALGTPYRLDRGTYYMALTQSSPSSTFLGILPTSLVSGGLACHYGTTSGSLPATITPSTSSVTNFRVPWMGISRNTTI